CVRQGRHFHRRSGDAGPRALRRRRGASGLRFLSTTRRVPCLPRRHGPQPPRQPRPPLLHVRLRERLANVVPRAPGQRARGSAAAVAPRTAPDPASPWLPTPATFAPVPRRPLRHAGVLQCVTPCILQDGLLASRPSFRSPVDPDRRVSPDKHVPFPAWASRGPGVCFVGCTSAVSPLRRACSPAPCSSGRRRRPPPLAWSRCCCSRRWP